MIDIINPVVVRYSLSFEPSSNIDLCSRFRLKGPQPRNIRSNRQQPTFVASNSFHDVGVRSAGKPEYLLASIPLLKSVGIRSRVIRVLEKHYSTSFHPIILP